MSSDGERDRLKPPFRQRLAAMQAFGFSRHDGRDNMKTEVVTAGIRPKDITEETAFFIRDYGNGDCLKEEKRKAKNGGEFKQYSLALSDGTSNLEIRYLFMRDLNDLTKEYGSDSSQWIGNPVMVKRIVQQREGIDYEHFELKATVGGRA